MPLRSPGARRRKRRMRRKRRTRSPATWHPARANAPRAVQPGTGKRAPCFGWTCSGCSMARPTSWILSCLAALLRIVRLGHGAHGHAHFLLAIRACRRRHRVEWCSWWARTYTCRLRTNGRENLVNPYVGGLVSSVAFYGSTIAASLKVFDDSDDSYFQDGGVKIHRNQGSAGFVCQSTLTRKPVVSVRHARRSTTVMYRALCNEQ